MLAVTANMWAGLLADAPEVVLFNADILDLGPCPLVCGEVCVLRGFWLPSIWRWILFGRFSIGMEENLPAMQESPVQFLGREDPLEKG